MLRRIFPTNSEEKDHSYVNSQEEYSFVSNASQEQTTSESSLLRSENIAMDEKQKILSLLQQHHRENVVLRSVLSQLEQENQQLKERNRSLESVELEIEKWKEQNTGYKQRILNLEQQLAQVSYSQKETEKYSQQGITLSNVTVSCSNSAYCKIDKEKLALENAQLRKELLEKEAIISSLVTKIPSQGAPISAPEKRDSEVDSSSKACYPSVHNVQEDSSKSIDPSHAVTHRNSNMDIGCKEEEIQQKGLPTLAPPPPPPPPPPPTTIVSSTISLSLEKTSSSQPTSYSVNNNGSEPILPPPPPPPPPPTFPACAGPPNLKNQLEPKKEPEVPSNIAAPTKPVIRPRKPMKFLYWRRVILPSSCQAIECSFWRSVLEIPFDTNEFESLFAKSTNTKVMMSNGAKTHDRKAERNSMTHLSVLDERRTHLVGVLLVSLPSMAIIQKALIEMDDGCLSAKDCNSLLKIFPSTEEQALLRKAKDAGAFLTHIEEFLYQLAQIPLLQIRTKVLLFKREFDERGENILRPLNIIHRAVETIETSKALKAVLGVVLSLGNYMNGGTLRGQADGFTLEILSKLSDTKALDNETTFLQYAAHIAYYEAPESRAIINQLKILREASKISLSEVAESLHALRTELKDLSEAVRCVDCDNANTGKLLKYLENFEGYAEKILNKLEELLKRRSSEFQRLVLMFGYSKYEAESLTTCDFFKELHCFVIEIGKLLAKEESLEKEMEAQNATC